MFIMAAEKLDLLKLSKMQLLEPYFEDFPRLLYDAQILDRFKTLKCRNNAHFGREKVNWEFAQVSVAEFPVMGPPPR